MNQKVKNQLRLNENDIDQLLHWYQKNKRILPWRIDKNPYHVWIYEIMLQQTRIEAVKKYYDRFMKRIPDIHTLATIPEDELLKLWEGLGYYSRARNLKKAAQTIEEKYAGTFPNTYEEIITLSGIGEYTASAIASICFGEKTSCVDGNVMRVISRICHDKRNIDDAKTKKELKKELEQIMPKEAGDFNEGLMELGETICIPNGIPLCEECPLKNACLSYQDQDYMNYPVRNEKKEKKELEYTVCILKYKNLYWIEKRKQKGILQNLWQFPNMEGKYSKKELETKLKDKEFQVGKITKQKTYTHIFTHQKWHMTSYVIELSEKPDCLTENENVSTWKDLEEIKRDYAIPTAFQPFLKELENN